MIPQRLTLKNFLSYRNATLDFEGLHIACICGENGAGKSSLLEAIAWAVWGQTRATSEDDVIHLGEMEAQVDFVFQNAGHVYRIIRSRQRNQSSFLEFQVRTPNGFRALTARGVRATQQLIRQHLRLDYETFVNSAYLRQGRADEFMLKRPSERKQILSDLLKLDQYDALAEQAKERSRQLKAEIVLIERSLEHIQQQIYQGEGLQVEQANIEAQLQTLQQQQAVDAEAARHFQALNQQRQRWLQGLQLQQHRQQELRQDCDRLQTEGVAAYQQLQRLEISLGQAPAVIQGYQYWQQLQADDETQTAKFQAHQAAQSQLQALEKEQSAHLQELSDRLRQRQHELKTLNEQRDDLLHTLEKTEDVEAALVQLRHAQLTLTTLNQLQAKAAPLMQRRQQLQTHLDQIHARLVARIESLDTTAQQLQSQHDRHPQVQQAVQDVAAQIAHLEARRAYQTDVREKGLERRSFMERLQADQRIYETQLAELDQKIRLLKQQGGVWQNGNTGRLQRLEQAASTSSTRAAESNVAYEVMALVTPDPDQPTFAEVPDRASPLCPLCDHPLDEHHWQLVLARHQEEYNEVLRQLWVIREQLAVSEREIQVLRQEYRELEQELNSYGATLELRGRLQQQLYNLTDTQTRLQQVQSERDELVRSLQSGSYAASLQEELQLLDQTLHDLAYDDRTHALARGDVDRWRWAEIRHAELAQAQRQLARLEEQRPAIETAIALLEQDIQQAHQSPLCQQIRTLQQQIAEIAYDVQHHTQLRTTLKEAQSWQIRYQELVQAQQQYPIHQQRVQHLRSLLAERRQELQGVEEQIHHLTEQLQQSPDESDRLAALDAAMQERRSLLDQHLAALGRLQQQQQQIQVLQAQKTELQQQFNAARRQSRIYLELAQAFGKNGIQALMIENVLPQLEAETNQILGRLTAHQLHVQFVTQRARKGSARQAAGKLIDTLDILISDIQGTRPYETYSGGEAFRVNFAIRLALARLLAQRSGTSLQMLIIDEGFGTQDSAGCSRLVSAIQAIAADFACILTVTHMPHLKEAFQTRIEVTKSQSGSHLQLVI